MKERLPRVYAYKMYPKGTHDAPVALLDTPENICAFVASRLPNENYVLTDIGDNFILSTIGSFLDRVGQDVDLQKLHQIIIPMQTGEVEIPEVNVISLDDYILEMDQVLNETENQEIQEELSQKL